MYQKILKLKNSKGDGIEWVNSDFKVNDNCNLAEYIKHKYGKDYTKQLAEIEEAKKRRRKNKN